jgi:hypothetical protein
MTTQTKEQRAYSLAVHQLTGFNAVFGTKAFVEFATLADGVERQADWGWPMGDSDERLFFELSTDLAERAGRRFRNVSDVIVGSIGQLIRAYDGRASELDPFVVVDLRALERVLLRVDRRIEAGFITKALKGLEEVAEDD